MADLKRLMVAHLERQLSSPDGNRSIPAGGELLWSWFLELNRTRTVHAAGVNPISFIEIEAFARVRRIDLAERHLTIIQAMDEAYLGFVHTTTRKAPDGVETLPPISKAPLTAGLVDAMFGGA